MNANKSSTPRRVLGLLLVLVLGFPCAAAAQDQKPKSEPEKASEPKRKRRETRGRPVYMRPLVDKFDADGNGRVEKAERAEALAWIRAEREKEPPQLPGRGGKEDPKADRKPRMIGRGDVESYPEAALYDSGVVQTIFLDFDQPEWNEEMNLFWRTGISTRAKLTMDGVEYADVGVRYRGTSSFFMVRKRKKKSFAVSMNWGKKGRRLKGYKSLNLLSGHADPTFMRTVLFAHIARHYVVMPKASFVHLVINGESWGLYINDQQMNSDFTKEVFGTRKGARWKVPPDFDGKAALAYQSTSMEDYTETYRLMSASGSKRRAWEKLRKLCRTLSESSSKELRKKLPKILDIDHALMWLAVDNVLMDGDGYHYRGSDYAIYKHPNERFYPMFRDNNEAFTYGGGPGGFGRRREKKEGPKKNPLHLDPLSCADEDRAALSHALLSVPKWRKRYLENCRRIAEEWLDWNRIGPLVEEWREMIEPMVRADEKALYGHDAFVEGLDQGSDRKPGLKKFFEERRAFLLRCDALN